MGWSFKLASGCAWAAMMLINADAKDVEDDHDCEREDSFAAARCTESETMRRGDRRCLVSRKERREPGSSAPSRRPNRKSTQKR
eukprot:923129-Rhodomonas_salina.1